ncbi:MAG: NmrA family NAD(P)-binding protein [Pseudomonadota bacterium]
MNTRILVTGATGTIGGAVMRALKAPSSDDRCTVVAGVRNAAKREQMTSDGIDAVPLDFDDPASVAAAMEGVDCLFLTTGYSVSMLIQSKTVLDAARKAGVRHVVHLGAWGSDTSPHQHLIWHAFVERYIEALGFSWTHLQPKTFMRNVLTALRPGSTTLMQFYGDTKVGWIDPADIAAVAAAALLEPAAHGGQTYQLAEDARSGAEVAAILAQVTGLPFTYAARDPHALAPILLKAGMEPTYANSLAAATIAIAAGEAPGIGDTFDTVQQVTGRPGTRWIDFAERHRERLIRTATAAVPPRTT